jgi:fructose-1,6-bisphosphatase/inositol monophosphatase family enzyme
MTLKETAIAAARAAGEIQKAHFGTILNVDESTRRDVKLEVDRLCEQAIVETIRKDWPDHAILTEEAGRIGGSAFPIGKHLERPSRSQFGRLGQTAIPPSSAGGGEGEHLWLIDPLDGTVNFFHGLPYFCASVACYRQTARRKEPLILPRWLEALGEPLVGVVYAPPTDELFVAEPGRGATRNDQPIRASSTTDLCEAIAAIGFGSRPGSQEHYIEQCARLAPRLRKLRTLGAAAYDLCNVACGRLTAFYEMRLWSWDIAAAAVVLREAGAVLDAIELEPDCWNVIAAAPGVYEEFRDLARGSTPNREAQ